MNALIDPDKELCKQVLEEWERGKQYLGEMENLYDDLYDMMRGERPTKNYDWQSNVVINKVFQVCWTAIPYITQKIFGATPVIGIRSRDSEGEWLREELLEYWHTMNTPIDKSRTPFFITMVALLLRATLNGVGIMKKTWHQKLKRETREVQSNVPTGYDEEGNQITEPHTSKQTETFPLEDWPHNVVVNNRDIVFDWLLQPGQSIRDGRFIIHRELTDLQALKTSRINYINLDKFEPSEVAAESEHMQDRSSSLARDGMDTPPKSSIYTEIETYERIGLMPVYYEDGWQFCSDKTEAFEGDVKWKEMIVTIGKMGGTTAPIRFQPNKYGLKNYIDVHIYLDSERFHSVGMIEPVRDLQTAINDNINAMFDEIWQNLIPPVIVNQLALWEWDTMKHAPGARWLLSGNPNEAIMFKDGSNVTSDAWRKHSLLDNELQLTSSITPAMQGTGKEKAATTNVLNSQMSQGRLNFVVKMVEQMGLIPSAQMDIMFARKFVHPKTIEMIVGKPINFGRMEEDFYKYVPAASSVKMEEQHEVEIKENIMLIQSFMSYNNPGVPKILNELYKEILRNRNKPDLVPLLDEDFYEPQSDVGQMQMLQKMMGGKVPSNEQGIPMSQNEKRVRQRGMNG